MGNTFPGVGLHLVPYLRQQGMAPTVAVGAVSLSFLASGIGNLMGGFGADRFAVRSLLVVTHVLRAASLALLLAADTPLIAYIFAVLHGCAEGGQRGGTARRLLRASAPRLHLWPAQSRAGSWFCPGASNLRGGF